MKILISTGIYPPKIGGPSQYAKNLKEKLVGLGHLVQVKTFDIEDRLPSGIRHIFFFLKIIPSILSSDFSIILDTYSVGFPTVLASKIFGKKSIIRTGGDFLWEQYSESHNKKILLSEFYEKDRNFTFKEKVIFKVTKWTLKNVSHTIFSTDWQRDIFIKAYGMDRSNTSIVENYFGPKEGDEAPINKEFIASTRKLVWKNLDVLKKVFDKVKNKHPEVELFTDNLPFSDLMNKMRHSYAVILVSLGDISPNMILDAIRHNRPFICTKELGIYERVKEAGIFVDPLKESEIEAAIEEILTEEGYSKAKEKVKNFNFVHTWENIAKEFISTFNKI